MKRSNIGMAVVGLVITVALVSRQPIPGGAEQMSGGDEWKAVEEALGRKGAVQPGDVYRVGLPRTDLKVKVQGVDVKAGFALGSYAAFRKTSKDAMVMGDLVLLDEEVPKVMSELLAQGLSVTALHNHLNEMSPHVMYMHYSGRGDVVKLAKSIRTALGASGTPFGEPAASGSAAGPAIDQAQVEAALGRSGRIINGILQVGVPRAERITDGGMELLPAMGVATAINFQPTGNGKAAITGDFVLIAGEVNPVARTLRAHGIEVTASTTTRSQTRLDCSICTSGRTTTP